MPIPEKIQEMKKDRFKGAFYQRKDKSWLAKQYKHKVTNTPLPDPPIILESKIDRGEWLSSVKVSAYATNILKIPGQKEKLLKSLEDSQNKTHDVVKEDPLLNNNCIFEVEHIEPVDMPIVLNSVDPKRE